MAKVDDYPNNSNKYKEAQKAKQEPKAEDHKIEKVVSGKVTTRRKPLGKKIAESFIAEDVQDVKSYILTDVLIPAAKDTLSDMVKQAIDMFLYGGSSSGSSSSRGTNYRDYYDKKNNRGRSRGRARGGRPGKQVIEVIFEAEEYGSMLDAKKEAEGVLDNLYEILNVYDQVSVNEYYELCGVTGDRTDAMYGWDDLSDAVVTMSRNPRGYYIELPKTIVLER